MDCMSWKTVESSSTCSSCGPLPGGASASTLAETSRSSGEGSAPLDSVALSSTASSLPSKHVLSSVQMDVHVSCSKLAPATLTRWSRLSAATCARPCWPWCRQRTRSATSSSSCPSSCACAAQKSRSTATAAAMPVLRTHAACALLEAAPCSAAGGPSSGSSSSRKTRAPNSPSSAPSATPASSPSSAKVDSMAALRTAGRGSSRTMSVRLCSSVHQSFCGTSAGPLRSCVRYLSRRSAAWSEMLSWRCWDAYSHTHATHSTWWSPRSSPCSVITASTVEKPAFVTESASSEAASPSTASIGRQPERMLCARDCTMWPRQPRMSSLTPIEVEAAMRSWKGLRNSRWNW
mmetsp:Transcript_41900/g.100816  ORF Transcript_41900/g.100816 Transcript_41900/m.100816 type:complete len:348 (-) Transcript_41900:1739-2782(-)